MAEENIFAQSEKAKKKAAPAPVQQPVAQGAPVPLAAQTQAPQAQASQAAKSGSKVGLFIGLGVGAFVLVLGVILALVINNNLNEKAIVNYEIAAKDAKSENSDMDSDLRTVFSNAGFSGYWSFKDDERTQKLHDDCLKSLGISEEYINAMNNIIDGEELYDNGKRKALNEGTQILTEATEAYKNAKSRVSQCDEVTRKYISSLVDIKFGDFKVVQESKYYSKTGMDVTIKNLDNTSHSYTIEIVAKTKPGKTIKTDTIYTDKILGGKDATYTAFDYCSDVADELKSATFEITEVSQH